MNLDDRISALYRGSLFRSVPEADLFVLAESMREEHFGKGEMICAVGDVADRVFLVVKGQLAVLPAGQSGHEISIGPGTLFGEYGLFDTGLRTATVTAVEPSDLLTLNYDQFRAFMLQFPEAMFAILGATVEQLLATQRKLAEPVD